MLEIGTPLLIKNHSRGEKYRCTVVGLEQSAVLIDYPIDIETERTVFLTEGEQLFVSYTLENRAMFVFETEVAGRRKDNIPVIVLDYPGDNRVNKIQRREYVRVEAAVKAAVTFEQATFPLVTEDLSAGGCELVLNCTIPFKQDDIVEVAIALPFMRQEVQYETMKAKVLRFSEVNKKRTVSLEFVEPAEQTKQTILRFCFEWELQMRRRGIEV